MASQSSSAPRRLRGPAVVSASLCRSEAWGRGSEMAERPWPWWGVAFLPTLPPQPPEIPLLGKPVCQLNAKRGRLLRTEQSWTKSSLSCQKQQLQLLGQNNFKDWAPSRMWNEETCALFADAFLLSFTSWEPTVNLNFRSCRCCGKTGWVRGSRPEFQGRLHQLGAGDSQILRNLF